MTDHFITDHGERVPYETVETVNTYENCIFSIKTEVKDKKKKHTFSMEGEAIECIKEFIKHKKNDNILLKGGRKNALKQLKKIGL